jgi:hypothetical protein
MNESSDLRKMLLAYRLGNVSRHERDALDEQIIGDEELNDRLAEAEYDWVDDYRADRLTAADRSRVERAFSPSELARPTFGAGRGAAVLPAPRGRRLPWLSLASSAALVALAGAVLFTVHSRNSERAISLAHSTAVAPPAQSHPSPNPKGSEPQSNAKQRAAEASRAVALLVLEPTVARGDQGPVLALQSATKEVRVQWILPADVSASSFVLSVTEGGDTLATSLQDGAAQLIDGSRVVEFHLSPSVFSSHPANSRFLFVVAEKSTRATVGEFPVVLRRN